MKAVLQDIRTGEVAVQEVPMPAPLPGRVLVRNICSLVSRGTEKAALEFGQANPIEKARKRPDLVRKVFEKAAADGIWQTYQAVRSRMGQPLALGYSSAGIVVRGSATAGLRTGDRVACAGFGFASHAEYISVPINLVTPIPTSVPFEQACFVTLGAIGMQGIRLAQLEIGETVIVYGLGLVGMVTAILARAAGCRVLGIDLDPEKLRLATDMGFQVFPGNQQLASWVGQQTGGHGADKLLLCAATPSSEPIQIAPTLLRQKGVVVVVGDVGMEVPRRPYYDREIDIRIARSYGPGRYDPSYEEGGLDYPYGYVRWTENRNMAAVLSLLASGQVDLTPLVTHRYSIDEARSAYQQVESSEGLCLGVVLRYASDAADPIEPSPLVKLAPPRRRQVSHEAVQVGVIGAGQFARSILLPAFARTKQVRFRGIHTAGGISSILTAKRYGMDVAASDPEILLNDPKVHAIVVASRHDSHAEYVLRGLEQEKAVFVEKPLAIREEDLDAIVELHESLESTGRRPFLMVGYNRRFAPLVQVMRSAFPRPGEPLSLFYRVNAGKLAAEEWALRREVGGGRILGECCHFLDLMTYLVGCLPTEVSAIALPGGQDGASITVRYADGSVGILHYITDGARGLGKEELEVHSGGLSTRLENFRRLKVFGKRVRGKTWTWMPQKGHNEEAMAVVEALRRDQPAPIPFVQLAAVSRLAFRTLEALDTGATHSVSGVKAREGVDHEGKQEAASLQFGESDRRGIAC